MQSALTQYLSDVLGLKWISKRKPSAPVARLPNLTVALAQAPSDSERLMIGKMLSAINVREHVLVVGQPEDFSVALAFGLGDPDFIESNQKGGRLLHSIELNRLIEGSSDSISQAKRLAWEHLKIVKSWLSEQKVGVS